MVLALLSLRRNVSRAPREALSLKTLQKAALCRKKEDEGISVAFVWSGKLIIPSVK